MEIHGFIPPFTLNLIPRPLNQTTMFILRTVNIPIISVTALLFIITIIFFKTQNPNVTTQMTPALLKTTPVMLSLPVKCPSTESTNNKITFT